jgi:hypothetical protein
MMDVAETGLLNLVYVNEVELLNPVAAREVVNYFRRMNQLKEDMNRNDTMTLITSRPIVWQWFNGLVLDGSLNYTIAMTKSESMFDIIGLPESEIILELKDVRSALLIRKMPVTQNVQCSVMCDESRIHWALGALKQSGRPDVSIYVNLKTLSPEMRGAST